MPKPHKKLPLNQLPWRLVEKAKHLKSSSARQGHHPTMAEVPAQLRDAWRALGYADGTGRTGGISFGKYGKAPPPPVKHKRRTLEP